jgi:hypothetical protein
MRIYKSLIYFSLFIIIINILFIRSDSAEGFTPKMREMYRPYVRKIRVYSENFYNKTIENVSTFFRKTGIL